MSDTAAETVVDGKSWDELEAQAQRLRERWPQDVFVDQMLTGAFRVARDAENPIRGNLLASACRELTTYLLHELGPEEEVRACAWFAQDPTTETVTRAQRAAFIAHGGLMPDYVEKTLGFAADDYVKPLTQAMSELNKRVHLKGKTVLGEEGEVRRLAGGIFDAIEGLLDTADECRTFILDELRVHIDRQVVERMLGEQIGELDILSGRTLVDGHDTREVEVVELGPKAIRFHVEGVVYVTLQWGSGSDFRNGDGATMAEEFPFEAFVIAAAVEPSKFEDIHDLTVDTDGWYE